jgi:hypothetical protein
VREVNSTAELLIAGLDARTVGLLSQADYEGLGISRRDYVAIEDGEQPPSSTQYEAICDFFGWPDAPRRAIDPPNEPAWKEPDQRAPCGPAGNGI